MKTVLITGSTRGIGKQIGMDLLNRDYFVNFNYAHDLNYAHKLYEEIFLKYSKRFAILKADLSFEMELTKLTSEIKELDVLILNAGITDRTPFGQITAEIWNRVFNVNLSNQFLLVQALKDNIKPGGKIIFVSSISGIIPDSVSIPYGVSKAAINMLVPYLAKEFASKQITVNAVAPGYTLTDWHIGKSDDQLNRISEKTLLKRFATTKEISSTVLHLIENNYITGQVIRVDGGIR